MVACQPLPPSRAAAASAADSRHRPASVVAQAEQPSDGHAFRTLLSLSQRTAALLDLPFSGWRSDADCLGSYVVPAETLELSRAAALGIREATGFFGGAVPHPFVAGKCVSHGLVDPRSRHPHGWVAGLASSLAAVVLPGYAAFAIEDARRAASRLLQTHGPPIRLKPAAARGGLGQSVHDTAAGAEAALRALPPDELARDGVVIEIQLQAPVTWSVGAVRIGAFEGCYVGIQRTTRDNDGREVYGGSTLDVVRGGWSQLLAGPLPERARAAVVAARCYDEAVRAAYPDLIASRSNYDVIVGRDAHGRDRTAVLEQSWRIGGASGAEVAALTALARDPSLSVVTASTHERYGREARPVTGADVLFDGDDPACGPMIKYVTLDHAH